MSYYNDNTTLHGNTMNTEEQFSTVKTLNYQYLHTYLDLENELHSPRGSVFPQSHDIPIVKKVNSDQTNIADLSDEDFDKLTQELN